MTRLLFWLLVSFVVVAAVRRLGAPPRQAGQVPPVQRMVACRVCGLNVPESEAIAMPARDGESRSWACCSEHARSAS